MDSPSASSPTTPSLVFTCPENPGLATLPYAQGQQQLRHDHVGIDVHLKVGETKLSAHRLVLMNSSPVLRAMLSPNWDPERNDVCELGEDVVDPNIVDDLLDFLYIRKVTLTMDNAKLLLVAANYLDLPTLKAGTEQFLTDHLQISSDDVLDWLYFSAMYQLDCLHKSCSKIGLANYEIVLKSNKILVFPKEFLVKLFNDLNEPISNMMINETMFELLIKWINFDLTTRSDSLFDLLKMFPLLEVSEKFIENTVLKKDIIINSQDSLELVKNALNELSKTKHLYCIGESVYRLDVSTGKWTRMAPMIHWRNGYFCFATIGDKIYIFGGRGEETNIEVFDIKHNRWTELAPMCVARNGATAVAMNGYIYVSGGVQIFTYRHVDRYCVATNECTSLAAMLKERSFHDLVPFNDYIYAIGGHYDGDKKTVEKYDPEANKWEMVPEFDLERGDFTVLHQGKFFAFNVSPKHLIDNVDTVKIYDPLVNSTETFQDSGAVEVLNDDAYQFCVSVGDKIWALHHLKGIFGEFDPVTRKWKKINVDMSVLGEEFHVVFATTQ